MYLYNPWRLSIIPTLFPKAPGTWLGKKTRNDFDTSDANTDDEEFQFLSKMTTAQLNAVTYNNANHSGEPFGRKRKIVNYKDFEFEKNETDEDF